MLKNTKTLQFQQKKKLQELIKMEKKLQFIDSAKFIASSLSNLVNNFSERSHRIKFKFGHENKKCKTWRFKYKYCNCFREYTNFKDNLIEYKSLCCNKNY